MSTLWTPPAAVVQQAQTAVIFVRRNWGPDLGETAWQVRPDLIFVRAESHTAGAGIGRCEFQHRYGRDKRVHAADLATVAPLEDTLRRWWIKVQIVDADGNHPQAWVGRIDGRVRHIFGGDVVDPDTDETVRSGIETFVAYEPLEELQRISISQSMFYEEIVGYEAGDNGNVDEINLNISLVAEWIPPMNSRDETGVIVGNRSIQRTMGEANADGYVVEVTGGGPSTPSSYLYHGRVTDGAGVLWSRYNYAEYILNRFVNTASAGVMTAPIWRLGGQADLLVGLTDTLTWSDRQTAADVLRELINPALGMDFVVRAHDDGFEIHVFALLPDEVTFGGATLPRNPVQANMIGPSSTEVKIQVVETSKQRVSRIRVLGSRVVACCSLRALPRDEQVEDVPQQEGGMTGEQRIIGLPSLVPRWLDPGTEYDADGERTPNELEQAYRDGTGTDEDEAVDHDKARKASTYAAVYQAFGAPEAWDGAVGTDPVERSAWVIPRIGNLGEVLDNQVPDQQTQIRATLGWTPLLEGFDYTQDPPADTNESGRAPSPLGPQVYVEVPRDPDAQEPAGGEPEPDIKYMPIDKAKEGIGVRGLPGDWGVLIRCNPNHLIARNVWDTGDNPLLTAPAPTEHEPVYAYDRMVATIAFETDQRLKLIYDTGEADGTTLDLEVDGAEMWWLAPNTVVGVDAAGQLIEAGPRVLRSDAARLALVMAGAIARYRYDRSRAEVEIAGLVPWGGMLGAIFVLQEQSGVTAPADHGVVTTVMWEVGEKQIRTIVKTGFAR